MRRFPLTLALAASLVVPATASAQEIVVKRVPGLDRAERLAVRQDADVKLVDALSLPNTELVKPDGEAGAALAALNANPDVLYAEADSAVKPLSNDTYFSTYLWGLQNTGQNVNGQTGIPDADIDAPQAWARSTGTGATVAVIDTGVETTHPDLTGQFTGNLGERGNGRETNGLDDDGNGKIDDWQGWDFVNGDNTVETQTSEHGTHVSGTIAALANNAVGVAGVAPTAKVVPVKVFGAPNTSSSASTLALAFDYAGSLGVPVVNASLGGPGNAQIVTDAINAHPNTLYVVAAGNDGANAAGTYPCNTPAANVVCVGASDNRDQRASFSNYSATYVDLFAPGYDIASTVPGPTYAFMDGTSMATPHVAGVAALLASADPTATSAQLKTALMASVDPVVALSGLAVTGGRLNANSALDALGSPAPSPSPTPTPTATPPVSTPTPTPPVATPTPTPPPVSTPVPTPTPPATPGKVTVTSLKVSPGKTTRLSYSLSSASKVTVTVTRTDCKRGKGCASASSRWSEPAGLATRTLTLHAAGGRSLPAGRYTLKVATATSARSVTFRVR